MLDVVTGLNSAVTPAGIPETDRATVPAKPPSGMTVIALLAVLPELIETAGWEGEIENPGWLETPLRSSIRCCPAGVPHPVTRSYPVTAE